MNNIDEYLKLLAVWLLGIATNAVTQWLMRDKNRADTLKTMSETLDRVVNQNRVLQEDYEKLRLEIADLRKKICPFIDNCEEYTEWYTSQG